MTQSQPEGWAGASLKPPLSPPEGPKGAAWGWLRYRMRDSISATGGTSQTTCQIVVIWRGV